METKVKFKSCLACCQRIRIARFPFNSKICYGCIDKPTVRTLMESRVGQFQMLNKAYAHYLKLIVELDSLNKAIDDFVDFKALGIYYPKASLAFDSLDCLENDPSGGL